MNFKEQLNKVRELKLSIVALEVANEVEAFDYEGTLSDEDFERVCSIVLDYYLDTDNISISDIVRFIFSLIEDGKTIDEIVYMDKYDFIDQLIFRY